MCRNCLLACLYFGKRTLKLCCEVFTQLQSLVGITHHFQKGLQDHLSNELFELLYGQFGHFWFCHGGVPLAY
ncbi:hypothetical protein RY27_07925 [Litorilinea aerophila]|nr:hypothetical protein RY27_07925 [Litorilinea aerophila]